MEDKFDYGSTLNLPKTSFKMKASLANKEPMILKEWNKKKIYDNNINKDKETFILHDGPPYANGDIHIGHVLNKVLKDIILKYKRLIGLNAPYVPGWDTHGLPIEHKVTEELGEKARNMTPLEIRELCKKYALKWVTKQKEEFIRLGIFGDWDDPYLTLNSKYEAEELRVFRDIYKNGYVYRGLKPVYWSPSTETALAEAEIEYQDVVSPSIYVKMDAEKDVLDKLGVDEASLVIWTTTPWTLPANLGISLNKDFDYGVYKTDKGNLIIAKELADKAFSEMQIENKELIKEFKGIDLDNTHYKHPFIDRQGLIMVGDHVTAEAGTGCVHTAPGHGQDDYLVGIKYGLEVMSVVDHKGHMNENSGKYEGLFYKKANTLICEEIENTGHLLMQKELSHSYPHDWRSKKPVIFRATEQWFIKVEEGDLREKTLNELKNVEFVPSWGVNRITSMIENRPDWCISRQRAWGLPIPIFYNEKDEIIFNDDIIERVIQIVEKDGSDAWFKYTAKELIGEELLKKYNLENIEIRKEKSIMDVWFDSGVSHRSVLELRENLRRPADLYLEGSDQHRGWFQTSLLTSMSSTGDAPYKAVFTHGFVNDGQGKKMSKSQGNVIYPLEVVKENGADILRLWSASVDYREDMRMSQNIIKQITDSYRKIRNTIRYILSNIDDFDYKKDKVPYENMEEIDKWAYHKLEVLKKSVTNYYDKYEFYNLFNEILYFCSVDMSSGYFEVIKDRLYVEKTDSNLRRSSQTVLSEVLQFLVRAISPVLSFTADEIWEKMPSSLKETESVHLSSWIYHEDKYIDDELNNKFSKIMELRREVNKVIEKARVEKIVGLSLDAKVYLDINNENYEFVKNIDNYTFKDYLIVSGVSFDSNGEMVDTEISGVKVGVEKADGEKCERCWKYEILVSDDTYPNICPRCASVLKG